MHPHVNIAVKVARLIGKMLIDAMLHVNIAAAQKTLNICYEVSANLEKSLTEAAINTILKAYPSHNVQTKLLQHNNNSEITWLIDPINGELNFWYGIPIFATSIAILNAEQMEHGIIYNPSTDELFIATKGSGARLNNKRLRVSANSKLAESLLGINSDLLLGRSRPITQLQALPGNNKVINRDLGSSALQLAFVAAGRLDGYCDHNLHLTQIAAGAVIVKEAGGYISDYSIKGDLLTTGNIIAANPKIYPELMNLFTN